MAPSKLQLLTMDEFEIQDNAMTLFYRYNTLSLKDYAGQFLFFPEM